jgi:hypothetical protein
MDPIHPGSIDDLKDFLLQFKEEREESESAGSSPEEGAKPTRLHHGDFFHDIKLHYRDLNREIARPGASPDIPDGAVGIRCDWDFWLVAYLPYRFAGLSCAQIAACIWPDIDDIVTLPDSGDYWWKAKSDDALQVPGEPFEVWATMRYEDDRDPEIMRIETFATEDGASAYIRRRPPQDAISYDIRAWMNGERTATAGSA